MRICWRFCRGIKGEGAFFPLTLTLSRLRERGPIERAVDFFVTCGRVFLSRWERGPIERGLALEVTWAVSVLHMAAFSSPGGRGGRSGEQ